MSRIRTWENLIGWPPRRVVFVQEKTGGLIGCGSSRFAAFADLKLQKREVQSAADRAIADVLRNRKRRG